MGWTAATNELAIGGWIVFGILFLWQLPHFMAISWMYREDYARGGFVMLSTLDENGAAVARQAIYYSLALLAVSVTPSLLGMTGTIYLAGAALGGAALLAASIRFFADRGARNARSLFMISNLYLLTVMLLLVVDARN
jgi:protoheme IX farnesyltransferase